MSSLIRRYEFSYCEFASPLLQKHYDRMARELKLSGHHTMTDRLHSRSHQFFDLTHTQLIAEVVHHKVAASWP